LKIAELGLFKRKVKNGTKDNDQRRKKKDPVFDYGLTP